MDGVIILKNADFSASNIGKIAIISNTTRRILTKQTKYSADSAEAVALNTYVERLEAGGFIGGENPLLTVLMLPCLAAKHDELFFNIAKVDAGGYPVDWTPDESTENSPYVLTDKGVYANVQLNSNTNAGLGFKTDNLFEAEVKPSFSIVNYLYDSITSLNAVRPIASCNYGLNITLAGRSASVALGSRTVAVENVRTDVPKGFYAMSYSDNELLVNLNGSTDEAVIEDSIVPTKVDILNNNFILLQGYAYDSGVRPNSSLIACGKAMTAEQLTTLKELTDTLMSKLGI